MTGIDRDGLDLQTRLRAWIAAAPPGFIRHAETLQASYGLDPVQQRQHEAQFEALALDLFAYQYGHVPLYARLCQERGRTPSRVRVAADVPFLAVEAFKLARVASFAADAEVLRFHTSGTTTSRPGVHTLWTRDLYDLGLERAFEHHVLPDLERVRVIRVVPAFDEAPHSSLAYMLQRVHDRFGTPASDTYAHADGLRESDLLAALADAASSGEPACLLGTTLAWAHVLDGCARRGWSVELPPGSRLMHTGGDKGRRLSVAGETLLQQIAARFGIPGSHVVGEYGMTELGSQCYTLGLRQALHGEPVRDEQRWSFPFWLRPRLVDPRTGRFDHPEVGLLAHHDLANLGSVAHVLTADLGVRSGSSFVLSGRAPRAELRGCGLAVESWLQPDGVALAAHAGPLDRSTTARAARGAAAAPPDVVRAFHLPAGIAEAQAAFEHVGDTGLCVPALGAPAAADVWTSAERGAAAWRALTLSERVARLDRLARAAQAAGPGAWRDALARSTGLSPAGLDAVWQATFAPTSTRSLERLLEHEGLDDAVMAALASAGRLPRRIVHVVSGNVLPATWHVLVRGWLLGAAQWVRPATREPLFAACVVDLARRHVPELAAATAVLWWRHEGSEIEAAVLATADAVTVQGDDASVASVRAKVERWAPAARFVGYGDRWSAAWIEAACQTEATALALARDVALFDQQGCLSPTWVFAESGATLETWCGALARGLETIATELPAGDAGRRAQMALRYWRACARVRQSLGHVTRVWESADSTAWCVVLHGPVQDPESILESPRDRHVVIVPFDDPAELRRLFATRIDRVQGVSVGLETQPHLPDWLRPTRVAPVGTLQEAPPDWPQDHRPPLGSLILPEVGLDGTRRVVDRELR